MLTAGKMVLAISGGDTVSMLTEPQTSVRAEGFISMSAEENETLHAVDNWTLRRISCRMTSSSTVHLGRNGPPSSMAGPHGEGW